jgi:hypothetical protein
MVLTTRARLAKKTILDALLSPPRREKEAVGDAKKKKSSAPMIVMGEYMLGHVIVAYERVRIVSQDRRNYLAQTSGKILDAKIAASITSAA